MSIENTAPDPDRSTARTRGTVAVRSAAVLAFAFGAGTAALLGLTPQAPAAGAVLADGSPPAGPIDTLPCGNTTCCVEDPRPAS